MVSRASGDLILRNYEPGAEPVDRSKFGMGVAGGAPGISSTVFFGSGPTVIVLSNYDEPVAEELGRQIVRSLPQLRRAAGTAEGTWQ